MIMADCTLIARLIIAAEDPRDVEMLWLRDSAWAAPVLWKAEFASVLLKYERIGQLSTAGAGERLRRALEILEHTTYYVSMERALESARRTGCSRYDSYYVALAEDLGAKLYTYEREVLKKCQGVAVKP